MADGHTPIGLLDHHSIARVRRIASGVMDRLRERPVWTDPIRKVATYAAVDRSVALMVQAGETDEASIAERALALVRDAASEASSR